MKQRNETTGAINVNGIRLEKKNWKIKLCGNFCNRHLVMIVESVSFADLHWLKGNLVCVFVCFSVWKHFIISCTSALSSDLSSKSIDSEEWLILESCSLTLCNRSIYGVRAVRKYLVSVAASLKPMGARASVLGWELDGIQIDRRRMRCLHWTECVCVKVIEIDADRQNRQNGMARPANMHFYQVYMQNGNLNGRNEWRASNLCSPRIRSAQLLLNQMHFIFDTRRCATRLCMRAIACMCTGVGDVRRNCSTQTCGLWNGKGKIRILKTSS